MTDQSSANPQEELDAIISGQSASGGNPPEKSEQVSQEKDAPVAGEMLVDWGDGVRRRVKIEDLVAAAKAKESAEAQARAAQDAFANLGQAKEVVDLLGRLKPEQRSLFMQALREPGVLTQSAEQNTKAQRDELEEMLSDNGSSNGRIPPELLQRLQQSEEFQRQVGQYLQTEIQQKLQASLSERAEASMEGFPVFSESAPGRKWAKDFMMLRLQANPEQDMDKLAAEAAANTHQILMSAREPAPAPRHGIPSPASPRLPEFDKPPSGDDMMSGSLARDLNQFFEKNA